MKEIIFTHALWHIKQTSSQCILGRYIYLQKMQAVQTFRKCSTKKEVAPLSLSSVYPRHGEIGRKSCGRPTQGPGHNASAERFNAKASFPINTVTLNINLNIVRIKINCFLLLPQA